MGHGGGGRREERAGLEQNLEQCVSLGAGDPRKKKKLTSITARELVLG